MTNNTNDYQDGKIYALKSYETDKVYIGSTTLTLQQRFSNHKSSYELYKKQKVAYLTSYEILKFEDCYITLLEGFPSLTRNDLAKREGHYQELYKDTIVNKNRSGRTIKEYYKEHADMFKDNVKRFLEKNPNYTKTYYQNNKDKFNKKQHTIAEAPVVVVAKPYTIETTSSTTITIRNIKDLTTADFQRMVEDLNPTLHHH